jgi:hypothetical protein
MWASRSEKVRASKLSHLVDILYSRSLVRRGSLKDVSEIDFTSYRDLVVLVCLRGPSCHLGAPRQTLAAVPVQYIIRGIRSETDQP